jgi:hypothetical protein
MVSGHLHVPTALPLGKQQLVQTVLAQGEVWTPWSREETFALPGVEPRFLECCVTPVAQLQFLQLKRQPTVALIRYNL